MDALNRSTWKKFKIVIICILLIVVGFVMGLSVRILTPDSINGSLTFNETVRVELSQLAGDETVITLTHEFSIRVTCVGTKCTYVTTSKEPVNYNVDIIDMDGDIVKTVFGSIYAPEEVDIGDTKAIGESRETVKLTTPGTYDFKFRADAGIDYSINQESKYQFVQYIGILLIVVGVLVIVIRFFLSRKKMAPAPGTRASTYPQGYGGSPGPSNSSVGHGYHPTQGYSADGSTGQGNRPSRASTLERQQGGYYTELRCLTCGNVVRSPIVNGVVTCEYCGDRAKVY